MSHFLRLLTYSCLLAFVCVGVDSFTGSNNAYDDAPALSRQKRLLPLTFYNGSFLHFICGFGIPVQDLEYEAITSGVVFRAEYGLPNSPQNLRQRLPLNIKGRNAPSPATPNNALAEFLASKRTVFSQYRWVIYKALALLAEHFGHANGRACVLRSICESAAVSFHYGNGLLGDLAHILLTPSSAVDELSTHRDNEYLHAEALGREANAACCAVAFSACNLSVLAQFSHVFDVPVQ